jgi:hypothetical protein
MTIFAFAGPSLAAARRSRFPQAVWLPPCGAGDLLRLAPTAGDKVCIIDGWFDHRPAIRHKEILLMLARGVTIFGASSIGALRAVEMAPCGMIGVGRIFRAFASGVLTGDDEVALVHAPEEWGWRPLSLPLVDARATLYRAVRRRVVTPMEARALMDSARQIHYVDRDWAVTVARACLPVVREAELTAWFQAEPVAQKSIDAEECLTIACADIEHAQPPPVAVRTIFLAELERQSLASPQLAPRP